MLEVTDDVLEQFVVALRAKGFAQSPLQSVAIHPGV